MTQEQANGITSGLAADARRETPPDADKIGRFDTPRTTIAVLTPFEFAQFAKKMGACLS